jgi:hypothetical protein
VGWQTLLEAAGFSAVVIGQPVDTFAGAGGESNARTFDVYGFAFLARRP